MKPDAMELLKGVEAFLLGPVIDQIPAGLRSDVRAAAKSISNARIELDGLYPLLAAECRELGEASERALVALGKPVASAQPDPPASLTGIIERHRQLLNSLGDLLPGLQQHQGPAPREALTAIYALLREQGRKRMGWQSVFPTDRLVSEVLIGPTLNQGE
jgi:hypothetical protein